MVGSLATADFVTDPTTPVDDLANAVHASAFDLLKQVIGGLRTPEKIDPASAGFLNQYAGAAGLGLVVMAFLAVVAVAHSMRGGGGREDLRESLFKYLPLAVFLMVFSPAIGVVLGGVANAATNGIAQWGAGTVEATNAKIDALAGITADKLPGGTFVGLLVSALIVIGALGVFLVLAVQKIGMPVAGLVAGVAWGMLVHPQWRPKALRAPGLWAGLMFVKPVLFLVLAAAFGAFGAAGGANEGVAGLVRLCLLAVALLITAAAPVALVRKFPAVGGRLADRQPSFDVVSVPIGARGPSALLAERPPTGPVMALESAGSGPSAHVIERAYERGQRDRGDARKRADGAREPSHLEESLQTEALAAGRDERSR